MKSEELLLPGVDLAALLGPISAASPTGANLRLLPRSVYLEIENLLDGRSVPELVTKDADGRQISIRDEQALLRATQEGLKQALACIATQSKDLDVLGLAVRGLLAVHGYEGLQCGLYLMREFHERFFPSMYPNPPAQMTTHDEFDDPLPQPLAEPAPLTERRVLLARGGAVEKMEHAVRTALKLTPLFTADDGSLCRVADWDSAQAPDAERSVEKLNALAASQPVAVFETSEQTLSECINECARLGKLLAERYARPAAKELGIAELSAPTLTSLEKELKDCRGFLIELRAAVGKKGGGAAAKKGEKPARTSPAAGRTVASTHIAATGSYQPKDRAEALSMILSAGQFLHRHEPLSPLPRLLFRIVQWGRSDSLRAFLDDMFRKSEGEQERVFLELGLDAENKLVSERLPSGCPIPADRADAFAMLGDVAARLKSSEPLSPLPYHLEQLIALAQDGSPMKWLRGVFGRESQTLSRIERLLGFESDETAQASENEI